MATGKPFKKTMLGVSLIHGQFRALAVVKGQTVGSWVCPYPIESFDHLGSVLAEAVRATRFPGKRVGFLVEDVSCVHQYHLVPPMKTAPFWANAWAQSVGSVKPASGSTRL